MNNRRRTPLKARQSAYNRQDQCCYYCKQPMWISNPFEFGQKFNLKESQITPLKCTAEHLHAWKDGGSNSKENIVAACLYCNKMRHRRNREMDPLIYQNFVQRRLSARRWHGIVLKDPN